MYVVLVSIISIFALLFCFVVSFNLYVYTLIKKEERVNNEVNDIFLEMFNKRNTKKTFKKLYFSASKKMAAGNRIFDKVESLSRFSIVKPK